MKKIVTALGITILSGCATLSPEQEQAIIERDLQANREPVCNNDSECKLMWDKAVYFVSSNAGMVTRTSSDNLIETFASTSMRMHVKVNKVPIESGKYRIQSVWGCGNVWGCNKHPKQIKADFNNYLKQ